ncbi:MAG: hypothetical protein WBI17_07210 [Clostridiaceae bacterium]
MTDKELKQYYAVITDCWQLFKKYSSPQSADEFWTDMLNEADALHIKHGQTIFSEKMLNAVLKEIEKIYQRGPDHGQAKIMIGNQESIFGGAK